MEIEDILDRLTALLKQGTGKPREQPVPAIPLSAQALLAWSLTRLPSRTVVFVADGPRALETAHRDILTLRPDGSASLIYYPAWETVPTPSPACEDSRVSGAARRPIDANVAGFRLRALLAVAEHDRPACLVATSVQAMMQKTASREALLDRTRVIRIGDDYELDTLAGWLDHNGYALGPEVCEKGAAALRGGLLDVWPLTEDWPFRVEFIGTTVESMRSFDPATQRSVRKFDAATLPPADELSLMSVPANRAPLTAHLPEDTVFLWSDVESIREHASVYEEMIEESDSRELTTAFETVRKDVSGRKHGREFAVSAEAAVSGTLPLDVRSIAGVRDVPRDAFQPDLMERARRELLADLYAQAGKGRTVLMFFDTQGTLDRFNEYLESEDSPTAGAPGRPPKLLLGRVSAGFVSDALDLAVVAQSDLYGGRAKRDLRYDPRADRPRPDTRIGPRINTLEDLEPGDLAVHLEHGLGRYMGLTEIVFSGQPQEVLTIEYAEEAKLHVPVSHAHLLSRYVGMSGQRTRLHRLGGKRWSKEKDAAQHSIQDLAAALLETQAHRTLLEGFAYPPDHHWQHEFEASFPYHETPEQHRAIEDVRNDMQSTRPMDRLVCGDAGYGKTEVAMRAVFKTVMAGKQAAVLVPTTVLAQQHFDTFQERMSAYPVRVEMLSRFRTRGQREAVLKGLAKGIVDIVIGTHALVQPGVRFHDLGLVIIDEEQRFGVAHKESLKHIRRLVDVLTLTATPIPRTLYMSMTGARDMSLLRTPPEERMAIETVVARNTDRIVREVILREINRDGQVFYLHNRVMSIDRVKERLERLLPEVRIEIAHGQMSSSHLASVMRSFVAGEFDVLLCTTIIESGMDIPRVNTILIDRADRFGIADLYQLRGRVGRSNRKAYAYLLLPEHTRVDSEARKRIGAVKRHSGLSAGFNLALRDLEIRGAGNLLGTEQSGHIAAVGFGLYCQLLRRTVSRLKGEPLPPVIDAETRLDFVNLSPAAENDGSAFLPYGYVEDERLRIEVYRKMAEATSGQDLSSLHGELRDRFGPVPETVSRLLTIARIRIAASHKGIRRVETRDGRVMMFRRGDYLMDGSRFPRLTAPGIEQRLDEILELIRTVNDWSQS